MDNNTNFAPVPAGGHKLPPLKYPYNALEPIIDEKTLHLHHDKHHKAYVDGLNKAELALVKARQQGDYQFIKYWEDELAFNGSGHILHSVYWDIMAPPGTGGAPGKYTDYYITNYFGSFENFKAQFLAAAKAVQGSGWCILGCSPSFFRLEILQAEKHQNLTQWGIIPIMVCDVWEHAYYLKYQNERPAFIDAWWKLIDWNAVERRLISASQGVLPIQAQQA